MEGYFGPPVCAENIYIFFFMAMGSPPLASIDNARP